MRTLKIAKINFQKNVIDINKNENSNRFGSPRNSSKLVPFSFWVEGLLNKILNFSLLLHHRDFFHYWTSFIVFVPFQHESIGHWRQLRSIFASRNTRHRRFSRHLHLLVTWESDGSKAASVFRGKCYQLECKREFDEDFSHSILLCRIIKTQCWTENSFLMESVKRRQKISRNWTEDILSLAQRHQHHMYRHSRTT